MNPVKPFQLAVTTPLLIVRKCYLRTGEHGDCSRASEIRIVRNRTVRDETDLVDRAESIAHHSNQVPHSHEEYRIETLQSELTAHLSLAYGSSKFLNSNSTGSSRTAVGER